MACQSGLEDILTQLLVPDNSAIQQATFQLKSIFKDPNLVPELCRILSSSTNSQIRQYAAILLRRKVLKVKSWNSLPNELRQSIKDNILKVLAHETEKGAHKSLSQLIGTIAKHDLSDNSWPDLIKFLVDEAQNSDPHRREVALSLVQTVCSSCDENIKLYYPKIMQVIITALDDSQNNMVCFHAVRALSEMVYQASPNDTDKFQAIVPKVVNLVKTFIRMDELLACEAMEFFSDIVDCHSGIVDPHVMSLVEFCLSIAPNAELGDAIRIKALFFISNIFTENKKVMLKYNLIEPVLQAIFPIICSGSDEDDNFDDESEVETSTPPSYSTQVVDVMALHLPPEKFIPPLMKLLQPAFVSSNHTHRRAAYLTMAVISEGCAEYITSNHMELAIDLIMKGVEDPEMTVRNAVMYTLGQFSENLQPKIAKYGSQILPLLYKRIEHASQEMDKNPTGLSKAYYALETFCESLGSDILPHLPTLVAHLLCVLKMNTTPEIKELIISAIGATANAAKGEMKVYFPEIIAELEKYLTEAVDEASVKLQIISIDTLSVLARNVGDDIFLPLTNKCMEFAVTLLRNSHDPDLKRSVYGLIGAISHLPGADMKYLSTFISYMIHSIKSNEGGKKGDSQDFMKDIFDFLVDDEENQEKEDDLDDDALDTVENAYLDEKEYACDILGELALNTKESFMPYVEECFREVMNIMNHPVTDIKRACLSTLTAFCCVVYDFMENKKLKEAENAVTSMVDSFFPKLMDLIKMDPDREAVTSAVFNLKRLISTLKTYVIRDTMTTEQILFCLKTVFNHELPCQEEDDEGFDANENEAEIDAMLVESAGDVLPAIARVASPDVFQPIFVSTFLPFLLKKTKKNNSVGVRAFGYGSIAEVVNALGTNAAPLVDVIYPVFQRGLQDDHQEALSNSIFGIGVLLSNSGPRYTAYYTDILKRLFPMLDKNINSRVRDNICAVACRFIKADRNAVPLKETFSVIMSCIPLQEDFEENQTVYNCIFDLYSNESSLIMEHLPKILHAISCVFGSKQISEDLEKNLVGFVQNVYKSYASQFSSALSSLPQDSASKINFCIAAA